MAAFVFAYRFGFGFENQIQWLNRSRERMAIVGIVVIFGRMNGIVCEHVLPFYAAYWRCYCCRTVNPMDLPKQNDKYDSGEKKQVPFRKLRIFSAFFFFLLSIFCSGHFDDEMMSTMRNTIKEQPLYSIRL